MSRKHVSDLQVCVAYEIAKSFRDCGFHMYPYDILAIMTRQPAKVCVSAMERAVIRGYVDYGVSLRSGWVTSKGRALMRDHAQGEDDHE